jgi:hypothetical protein
LKADAYRTLTKASLIFKATIEFLQRMPLRQRLRVSIVAFFVAITIDAKTSNTAGLAISNRLARGVRSPFRMARSDPRRNDYYYEQQSSRHRHTL